MTEHLQQAQAWLTAVLAKMDFVATVITGEQGLEIVTSDQDVSERLLAEGAQTLDALQSLLNVSFEGDYVTLEHAGYRQKRTVELQSLLELAVTTVRETGEPYKMPPLPAIERRYVHTLADALTDIESFSEGKEPQRYLVLKKREE